MSEVWQSVKEYIALTIKRWWSAMSLLVGLVALVFLFLPDSPVPSWVAAIIVFLGLLVAPFGAFHRVRLEREKLLDRQLAAISDLLAEVRENKRIAQVPFTGRLLRFSTDKWDIHKAQVDNMPERISECISNLYLQLRDANTIVDMGNTGQAEPAYCYRQYSQKCGEIAKQTAEVEEMLHPFLSSS